MYDVSQQLSQLSQPLVLLSRAISFSIGRRLYHPDWDQQTNQRVFGRAIGPHGVELCWRVVLRGPVSAEDGMIVNIAAIKPLLAQVAARLENRFLDREFGFFQVSRPTAENIARYLLINFPDSVDGAQVHRIELDQSNGVRVEIVASQSANVMKVSYCYEFAAAHRLFAPTLSDQENWRRFDKCSNPAGHGHNFQLRVWVEGEPDAESGFVINPTLLNGIVEEEVYERFDHKHLNEDCPEFTQTGIVPTSENLAKVIFDLLRVRLDSEGYRLARVGLQETQKNYFEVEA